MAQNPISATPSDRLRERFLAAADRLIAWARDAAMPLWRERGIDTTGRFVEAIAQNGQALLDAPRRVRVQFRQVYAWHEMHRLGLAPGLAAAAHRGFAHAIADSCDGAGDHGSRGCALLLDGSGRVTDPTRDLYTQAFLLLAAASEFKAGNSAARDVAHNLCGFLHRDMASGAGGFVEALPATLPRRQNPHMHLFEAFIALEEAMPGDGFLARAGQMFALFRDHFFDPDTDCLLEYFDDQWAVDTRLGHSVEPGHMMEWVWLLHHYSRLSGQNTFSFARRLYRRALAIGIDPASGLLVDETDTAGGHLKRSKRSWPQTEFLKAALVMDEAGEPDALEAATFIIESLLASYLETQVRGLWHDRIDEVGHIVDGPAPASTFYHLVAAIGETMRAAARHAG